MAVDESRTYAILSSISKYNTVNILELMSLTSGLDDEDIRQSIPQMAKNDLVRVTGEGDDQFVSLTNKGYEYLSSQLRAQLVQA